MTSYEPRWPHLTALGLLGVWVVILALPMLGGAWLAGPYSDQYATGYAFRTWGADAWRSLGHIPLWNPMLFAGLPFVAAMHGDIFYPTSFLRLLLPMPVVMNLGFVLHYVLAGALTYTLLRRLGVSWAGGVAGGIAYQLSGLLASYPQPGHDGKLFVSTMLPLALLALVLALRERRWIGYPLLALAIGLGVLSPHAQMLYYMLVATGLFALYLAFGERPRPPLGRAMAMLAGALGAVVVGFGIGMIQVLPFYHYIPFSPRATSYYGYEGATTWAIPWNHVPEFFLANFVGSRETYWGGNFAKLHSEYLGLPVIALAVLGAGDASRRRLVAWVGGIGMLFLLVSLGGATPFYRVWWAVMPFMQKVRAAGMAFYIVAFVVAILAALGVDRLQRREGEGHPRAWLVAAVVVAVLAVTGALGDVARALAAAVERTQQRPAIAHALAARSQLVWGALGSAAALAAVGGLAWAWLRQRATVAFLVIGIVLVVGADLWRNASPFWTYSHAHEELFQLDTITRRLTATPAPYRALDLGVYPNDGSALMAFGIPQLLGHHGNELHRFDELLGGKNQWRNLSPQLLRLFAVRYVITPAAEGAPDSIPGYRRVLDGVETSAGIPGRLFERAAPAPYARVVPGALKLPDSTTVATLTDPRLPGYDRVVFLALDAPVEPVPLTEWPEPSSTRAVVTEWRPGAMTVTLHPAPPRPGYLLVAENWYPDWQASVDGAPARVLRGDHTLITVALPAGARRVELAFRSGDYRRGKLITILSLMLVLAGLVLPFTPVARRLGG